VKNIIALESGRKLAVQRSTVFTSKAYILSENMCHLSFHALQSRRGA